MICLPVTRDPSGANSNCPKLFQSTGNLERVETVIFGVEKNLIRSVQEAFSEAKLKTTWFDFKNVKKTNNNNNTVKHIGCIKKLHFFFHYNFNSSSNKNTR